MNNSIKEYITKNMRKLTNRYVEEFKEDLEIDLSTLNETTTFPALEYIKEYPEKEKQHA